jgi:hypothetical protein
MMNFLITTLNVTTSLAGLGEFVDRCRNRGMLDFQIGMFVRTADGNQVDIESLFPVEAKEYVQAI